MGPTSLRSFFRMTFFSALCMAMPMLANHVIAQTATPAPQPVNLISNPGFEDESQIDPDTHALKDTYLWSEITDRPVAKAYVTDKEKASGKYSLCIERLDSKGNARLGLKNIPVVGGKRYNLTVMIKTTAGSGEVIFGTQDAERHHLEPRIEDPKSTTQGVHVMGWGMALQRSETANPDGFNRADITFTVPKNAVSLHVEACFSHTMGTAWFDDFCLTPVD